MNIPEVAKVEDRYDVRRGPGIEYSITNRTIVPGSGAIPLCIVPGRSCQSLGNFFALSPSNAFAFPRPRAGGREVHIYRYIICMLKSIPVH